MLQSECACVVVLQGQVEVCGRPHLARREPRRVRRRGDDIRDIVQEPACPWWRQASSAVTGLEGLLGGPRRSLYTAFTWMDSVMRLKVFPLVCGLLIYIKPHLANESTSRSSQAKATYPAARLTRILSSDDDLHRRYNIHMAPGSSASRRISLTFGERHGPWRGLREYDRQLQRRPSHPQWTRTANGPQLQLVPTGLVSGATANKRLNMTLARTYLDDLEHLLSQGPSNTETQAADPEEHVAGAFSTQRGVLKRLRAPSSVEDVLSSLEQAYTTQTNPIPQTCGDKVCGANAWCQHTVQGSQCLCSAGFIGDGMHCSPPSAYIPEPLLPYEKNTSIADLHLVKCGLDKLLLVYRDKTDKNRGKVMLGRVRPGHVSWGPPASFCPEYEAHQPQIAALTNGRFVIAFRHRKEKAKGFLVGGYVATHTSLLQTDHRRQARREAEGGGTIVSSRLEFGPRMEFASMQSGHVALVPLPRSRVAMLFEDKVIDIDRRTVTPYGKARLLSIGPQGVLTELGEWIFASQAVRHLRTLKVADDAFVLAYKEHAAPSRTDTSETILQEAKAKLFYQTEDDLVMSGSDLNIGAARAKDRALALVAANRFVYVYDDSASHSIKQVLVQVETNHTMHILQGPLHVSQSPSPYLAALALSPGTLSRSTGDNYSIILHQGSGKDDGTTGVASICTLIPEQQYVDCQENLWSERGLSSVQGVLISHNVILLVFADSKGSPYYQLMGLAPA
mmetsp:Transcript_34040/g.84162  ORF Transcript_34040/g.84162 Transcript_34040/m.84162 type:complete len:734 (+) Transcript_34040:709-2910(+)